MASLYEVVVEDEVSPQTCSTIHTPYGSGYIKEILSPCDDIPDVQGVYNSEVYFTDKNGRTLNINSLLPEGSRIAKDPSIYMPLCAFVPEPVVVYGADGCDVVTDERRSLWQAGDIISLFHEGGHAEYDKDQTPEFDSLESRLHASVEEKIEFNDADAVNLLEVLAKERRAWAFAFNKIREVKQSTGINLEPELVALDDFLLVIHGALASYENTCMNALFRGMFANRKWKAARRRHVDEALDGLPRNLAKHAIRPSRGWPIKV